MQSEDVQKAKQRYYAIKDGNRYYVAVAVLEYDPNAVGDDEDKKRGVAEVERMLTKAMNVSPLSAADVTCDFASFGPMNTSPFAV